MSGYSNRYEMIPIAAHNAAVEAAAQCADAEAERMDGYVAEVRQSMARAPRRGQKRNLELYKSIADAARRIAIEIRKGKVTEEEK